MGAFIVRGLLAGVFLVLSLASVAAQSEDEVNERIETLLGASEAFATAFEVLREAVGAHDAATVASLVRYPLNLVLDGQRVSIEGEEQFTERYDEIVTPPVAEAVTNQSYGDLFVNSDGVMFGDGEVWINAYCTDSSCDVTYWLIRAINVPE